MDDQTQQLPVCPPSFTEKGEKAEIVEETQFLPECAPATVHFFWEMFTGWFIAQYTFIK